MSLPQLRGVDRNYPCVSPVDDDQPAAAFAQHATHPGDRLDVGLMVAAFDAVRSRHVPAAAVVAPDVMRARLRLNSSVPLLSSAHEPRMGRRWERCRVFANWS
jgi:hypothetical protein